MVSTGANSDVSNGGENVMRALLMTGNADLHVSSSPVNGLMASVKVFDRKLRCLRNITSQSMYYNRIWYVEQPY